MPIYASHQAQDNSFQSLVQSKGMALLLQQLHHNISAN